MVAQGIHALSIRKIGTAAGLNPTLVTYYFKSILNLLDELCALNLNPMLHEWKVIEEANPKQMSLDDALSAWLTGLLHPAAFTLEARALIVLYEIASHGEPRLQSQTISAMTKFGRRLHKTLVPLTPNLSENEQRARLHFISGSTLGRHTIPHEKNTADGAHALVSLNYLLPFAKSALGM